MLIINAAGYIYNFETIGKELQADLARQLRVQQSASRLEEQYNIERKEQKLLPEAAKMSEVETRAQGKLEPSVKEGSTSIPSQDTIEKRKRMMAPPSTPPPETESWTPRTIRR
jgi:ribosomal protein S8